MPMPASPTAASWRSSARPVPGAVGERGAGAEATLGLHVDQEPRLPDLLYVENLVARDTVNTMPLETIDAYQDHGNPSPEPFTAADIEQARADLDRLADVGVDYDDVVKVLENEGVDKFTKSGWNCSRTSRRHRHSWLLRHRDVLGIYGRNMPRRPSS